MSEFTLSIRHSIKVWRMELRLIKAQADARLHHLDKMEELLDEYNNIENLPYYEVFDRKLEQQADLLKVAKKIEGCFKALKEV